MKDAVGLLAELQKVLKTNNGGQTPVTGFNVEVIEGEEKSADEGNRGVAELLDTAIDGCEQLLTALKEIRNMMDGSSAVDIKLPSEELLKGQRKRSLKPVQSSPTPADLLQKQDPEALEAARERARSKIRGGSDTIEESDDEEDDVPFVGQVRATLAGKSAEETSIGVVGTIPASLPSDKTVEES